MPNQSRIISSVLSPAVGLWLRSQVEHVENLQVKIEAGDRQILSGQIQRIFVSADRAVYQGLHLSHIQLQAEKIRVNLGQVIKGHPLHLLEPVPVSGELVLQETDLNASLQAPLLANAVTDFLMTILKDELTTPEGQNPELKNFQAVIKPEQLVLGAELMSTQEQGTPVAIRTDLQIEAGRQLKLVKPEWLPHMQAKRGLSLADLEGYIIDLGPEVKIDEFLLADGQITCRGGLMVIP